MDHRDRNLLAREQDPDAAQPGLEQYADESGKCKPSKPAQLAAGPNPNRRQQGKG
jgi:hypothetical protein